MTGRLRAVRIVVLVTILVLALPLAVDFATDDRDRTTAIPGPDPQGTAANSSTGQDTATNAAGGPDNATNVSGGTERRPAHLAFVVDAHGPDQLTVVDWASGEVVFRTDEYDLYHDVDPSPEGSQTLLYVASDVHGGDVCPDHVADTCTRNVLERINYSTGEREVLYSRVVNYNGSSMTHDVDRISGSRYLVGDIQFDRIFVVDVRNDSVVWTWNASAEFDRSSGGLADDWTHLNDVEVLDEDLYVVSLRNQDQVVFVHREAGLLGNRTLGADDDHGTLHEQHNPDYIPEDRGGPAIVVADSENNRVVEYQRQSGDWTRTWEWFDEELQWPRDADRLPNDNTLVVDTHGRRILEVTPSGDIVRQRHVPRGVYEAELLSTGRESEGGRSMAAIRGQNGTRTDALEGIDDSLQRAFLDALPPVLYHGLLYLLPTWVSPLSGGLLFVAIVLGLLWATGEGVRYALPRRRRDDEA